MQLSQLFTDKDRAAINQAVQDAEAVTSAEIVPVVAATSGRYDRSEDIVGLWGAMIALTLSWAFHPMPVAEVGHWQAQHPIWHLVTLLAYVILGFFCGVLLAHRWDLLRRLFTPRVQLQEEFAAQSRATFFDTRVHHTKGSSGVMLYVSLFEHLAAVIVDEKVLQAIGQEKVDALCTELTQRLHNSNPTQALCETIHSIGQLLGPLLPNSEHDGNELPDALLLIE